ncbi:hypothetical protein [Actinomadura parmotrematis]|uniref:EfeO-type cupredoxin-like domain-containing protein n=1 Tax=Actinomadura parmotrematis TaxID=2864039 RepID=A0ABS7FRG7_9ACTN|nr:hypothetical protein [Actinomadura parmotrematis]MBW8482565.1 hypothetical protein [Actinomadura parmotrematis]
MGARRPRGRIGKRPVRMLVPAVAAVVLACGAACGEPPPDAGGATGTPATAATPSAAASGPAASPGGDSALTQVNVSVTQGRVRASVGPGGAAVRTVKVRLGARVQVTVTSDVAEEFHLHGYDREAEVAAGRPASLRFTADRPGVFEAEFHHSGARAFELQVK